VSFPDKLLREEGQSDQLRGNHQGERMRNRGALIGAGLAVAVAGFVWNAFTDHQLGVAFERIAVGDARERVSELMGAPHEVRTGCGYLAARPAPGCVEEYLYFPFWGSWLVGEAWSVSLSRDGLVVSTAHFVSP
jgi:hypothetical protein